MIKGIAIVKSTANKCSCNCLDDSKKHISANIDIILASSTLH